MKMKATKITGMALVLAMLLMPALGAVAQPPASNSESNIKFKPGEITIDPEPDPGEVGFDSMTINFGQRTVPIRAERYYADGTSDSAEGVDQGGGLATSPVVGVLITDSRQAATGWTYKVKLSQYVPAGAGNGPFDATMYLQNGSAYTNVNQSKLGTALQLAQGGSFTIETNGAEVLLLTATRELGKGSHGARWNREDISLQLGPGSSATGFEVITNDSYTATMTWTLETTQ